MNNVHIALATDENCVWGCAVTIRSIAANTPAPLHFHVLVDGVSQADLDALDKTVSGIPGDRTISFYDFDADAVRHLVRLKHVTRTTYTKLFLGDVLPGSVERCIWSDCDVLFERDAAELFDMDLQGNTIAGVDDGTVEDNTAHQLRLGLKEPKYFNAGILLIDLAQWRERDYGTKAMEAADRVGAKLILQDQDALNMAAEGEWIPIDGAWNWFVEGADRFGPPRYDRVLHLVGAPKPWHAGYEGTYGARFYSYLDQTAFAGRRPWNPAGVGGFFSSARRRIPFLPGVIRAVRARIE